MSELISFTFRDTPARVVTGSDGEPWFVVADVARVLELSNPSMVAQSIEQDDLSSADVIDSIGRTQRAHATNEAGLYRLIFQSRKVEAKLFQRWVTHEVLPQIRRTGSYSVSPAVPQSLPEALRAYADEVEQFLALEARVEADAPKVLFADSVATADTTILVGDLAKILRGNGVEVAANRLFAMLRDDGYLMRRAGSDWNMPTQYAIELGLFQVKETEITHADGHVTVSKTPKVTGKGQQYFVSRYMPVECCRSDFAVAVCGRAQITPRGGVERVADHDRADLHHRCNAQRVPLASKKGWDSLTRGETRTRTLFRPR